MNTRTFRTRGAAMAVLVGLGLAACETDRAVLYPPSPLTITVSPVTATLTAIGATAPIAAQVTGGATGTAHTVTWSSSNPAVATVDATGLVKAVSAGTASVVAKATADTTVRAAATVTVQVSGQTDVDPPLIRFAEGNVVAENAIFGFRPVLDEYSIDFADAGSGFPSLTPVQVIERADTGGDPVCVDGAGPGCATPVLHGSEVGVDGAAGTQEGYITMSAFVQDRAGNRSNTLTRSVLVDYTSPQADSLTAPGGPLVGGMAQVFRGWFQDNLVLARVTDVQLAYEAAFLKDLPPVALGVYGPIIKNAHADVVDAFFIRTFRFVQFTGWVRPLFMHGLVWDLAGNRLFFSLPVPGLPGPPTTDPYARVSAAAVEVAPDSVSVTATLILDSDAITVPPNAQVQFYKQAAGRDTLVASATAHSVLVDRTEHTATFTWTATVSSKVGGSSLMGMFVTGDGIGLCVPPPF